MTAVPGDDGAYALFEFTGALPRARLYSNWQISTNDTAVLKRWRVPNFDPQQTVLVSTPLPVAPAVTATNENSGTVEYKSYAPKKIVLDAKADTPSVLLLNDKYDPHWQVFVDGKPAELLRCNFIMRGVYLTPGAHTVEFKFTLPNGPLYVSLAAIIFGILLSGCLLVWQRRATASRPKRNLKSPSAQRLRIFHERIAEQVANGHLRVFHPAIMGVVDDNDLLRNLGHASAFGADQGHGVQSVLFCPGQGLDAIGRIAADAEAHRQISRLAVILQLPDKNVLVGIVVGQGRHPAHVVVERENPKAFAHFVRSTLSKIRGKMRGSWRRCRRCRTQKSAGFPAAPNAAGRSVPPRRPPEWNHARLFGRGGNWKSIASLQADYTVHDFFVRKILQAAFCFRHARTIFPDMPALHVQTGTISTIAPGKIKAAGDPPALPVT